MIIWKPIFQNEERYMKEINYDDFEIHKKLHENIITQLNDFIRRLSNIKLEAFWKRVSKNNRYFTTSAYYSREDRKIVTWQKSFV